MVIRGGDHGAKLAAERRFKKADGPRVLVCTAAGQEGINCRPPAYSLTSICPGTRWMWSSASDASTAMARRTRLWLRQKKRELVNGTYSLLRLSAFESYLVELEQNLESHRKLFRWRKQVQSHLCFQTIQCLYVRFILFCSRSILLELSSNRSRIVIRSGSRSDARDFVRGIRDGDHQRGKTNGGNHERGTGAYRPQPHRARKSCRCSRRCSGTHTSARTGRGSSQD